MIKDTITFVTNHLQKTQNDIDTWFDKPISLRTYRPQNDGWTINEILEHISLTNHFLLILIEKGTRKALNKNTPTALATIQKNYDFNQAALDKIGQPTTFQWMRPEHHQPSGNVDMSVIQEKLTAQFNQCLEVLKKLPNGEGALHKTTMSVNDLGKIDVYQYIYFLSKHAERHIRQMEKNLIENGELG